MCDRPVNFWEACDIVALDLSSSHPSTVEGLSRLCINDRLTSQLCEDRKLQSYLIKSREDDYVQISIFVHQSA